VPDKLHCDAYGTIEDPNGVIIITRIFVDIHLKVASDKRAAAERAITFFVRDCPIHETLKNCIDIVITPFITEEEAAG
jgi:uncharacterized OsmC-like protein